MCERKKKLLQLKFALNSGEKVQRETGKLFFGKKKPQSSKGKQSDLRKMGWDEMGWTGPRNGWMRC